MVKELRIDVYIPSRIDWMGSVLLQIAFMKIDTFHKLIQKVKFNQCFQIDLSLSNK